MIQHLAARAYVWGLAPEFVYRFENYNTPLPSATTGGLLDRAVAFAQIDLAAGESWGPVRAGRPHLVTNPGEETATLRVFGMGERDFVTLPDQER